MAAPRLPAPDNPLEVLEPGAGWLRLGVFPVLLAADLLALAFAAGVTPGGRLWSDLLMAAMTLTLYGYRELYRPRLSFSLLDDLPALVTRPMLAAALVAATTLLTGTRGHLIETVPTAAVFVILVLPLRAAIYALARRARTSGRISRPTLLVGAGRVGVLLAKSLTEHREYGLRPVGFLDSSPTAAVGDLPVLGGEAALARVIVERRVESVVVAFPGLPDAVLVDLVLTCDWLDCDIYVVPRFFELHHADRSTDQVRGVPLQRMRRPAFRSVAWRVKRMLDVCAAAVGLVVCAPLLASLAVAVRLDGGPGVLFRQDRVGRGGRTFSLVKFRSMRPVDQTESEQRWSIGNESRVGPVGRVLRATSLDELPQLWNVLCGDMSLVGPRPERPYFVSEFTKTHPRYHARLRVHAGMTGWAQVHGLRGDTSIEERVAYDNFYITNWSLWLDVKILFRTVLEVFRRSGS